MGQPSALRLIHTYKMKTSLMADLPVPGNLTSKQNRATSSVFAPGLLKGLSSTFMVSIWCPLLQGKAETGQNAIDRKESLSLSFKIFIWLVLLVNWKIW